MQLLDETAMDINLRREINSLLIQKETAAEKSKITTPPPIADWIRSTCERMPKEAEQFSRYERPGWEPLHQLMNDIVKNPNS